MKVLNLINTLSAGGAELHLLTLCRYLKQAGVGVAVGYLKEGRGSKPLRQGFEANGVPVKSLDGDRVWDVRYFARARRWVGQEQPDILHTHLPRADLVGRLLKAGGVRVPWVVSVHGIYSRHWRGKWSLPLFSYIWRRADAVIAISHAVKEWLVMERGIPQDKMHVVHYGIEVDRFAYRQQPRQGREGSPIIGTVGRLEPIKGHETLIQAMPLVLRRYPQARLLIAGHDPWGYGASLKRLIQNLKLDGKVQLLGFLEDVPSFLQGIDLFAFASRSEGFGQVLIEAMAAGKPVVASRIPPITEIVLDGETGLLAPPEQPKAFAQAILKVLSDHKGMCRMGQAGRQRVEEYFNVKRMTEEIVKVYQRVLG